MDPQPRDQKKGLWSLRQNGPIAIIVDKILARNASFHMMQGYGKNFHEFFASIQKTFFLRGRISTRLQFYDVLGFT